MRGGPRPLFDDMRRGRRPVRGKLGASLAGAALILVLVARKCYTCWKSCSWPCCPRKARTRRRPGSARKYRSVRRRTDYSDDDDDDEAFDDVEERDYY